MYYPWWYVPVLTSPMLIAIVAVIHVLVAHYAVGGGILLAIENWRAHRAGDELYRDYWKKHARFFVLLTVVFGAVTGVGIWWTIGLTSPLATETLIRTFVFGWAIEWVFFIVEIVAAFAFYYYWDRLSPGKHSLMGGIYAFSAWISLVLITGITAFMLNRQGLFDNGLSVDNFWHSFLNVQFIPQTLARTGGALILATIYVYLHIVLFEKNEDVREQVVRRMSIPSLVGAILLMIGVVGWYIFLPETSQLMLQRAAVMNVFMGLLIATFLGLVLLILIGPMKDPKKMSLGLASALFLFGTVGVSVSEFVREGVRKPFIVDRLVYGHQIYMSDVETFQKNGFLKSGIWTDLAIEKILAEPESEPQNLPSGDPSISSYSPNSFDYPRSSNSSNSFIPSSFTNSFNPQNFSDTLANNSTENLSDLSAFFSAIIPCVKTTEETLLAQAAFRKNDTSEMSFADETLSFSDANPSRSGSSFQTSENRQRTPNAQNWEKRPTESFQPVLTNELNHSGKQNISTIQNFPSGQNNSTGQNIPAEQNSPATKNIPATRTIPTAQTVSTAQNSSEILANTISGQNSVPEVSTAYNFSVSNADISSNSNIPSNSDSLSSVGQNSEPQNSRTPNYGERNTGTQTTAFQDSVLPVTAKPLDEITPESGVQNSASENSLSENSASQNSASKNSESKTSDWLDSFFNLKALPVNNGQEKLTFLFEKPWTNESFQTISLEKRQKIGKTLFLYHCNDCHALQTGYSAIAPLLAGESKEDISEFVRRLNRPGFFMPPWSGTDQEREMLAEFLASIRPEIPLLEKNSSDNQVSDNQASNNSKNNPSTVNMQTNKQ